MTPPAPGRDPKNAPMNEDLRRFFQWRTVRISEEKLARTTGILGF